MSTTTPAYKIGLCLAGASTGGAYSAGVMDFLLEAMTAWDLEKNAPNPHPSIPQWHIDLTEIIGTSAGGINSVLTVNALNTEHQPLPRNHNLSHLGPRNNSLFQLWVYETSYNNTLQTKDLDKQKSFNTTVQSLMYAGYMRDTVAKIMSPSVIHNTLPPWADHLYISITTTNMRGVPYSVDNFTDERGSGTKYHMRKYADHTQFRIAIDPLTVSEAERKNNRVVNLSAKRSEQSWQPLINCARATASIPVGFPSVSIQTPRSEYDRRMKLPPDWAEDSELYADKNQPYSYAAVDGGVCNNEPFGILIDNMEKRNGKNLEAEPRNAWGSVILVDPFPSIQSDPQLTQDGMPIAQTVMSLFKAVRGEASFKEEEIAAALSDSSMEKFLIAPKTIKDPSQDKKLATAQMGAFAGMLHPKIPYHDFVLGRANCQYFLQHVFVMKREDAMQNPIFKDHLDSIEGDMIPIIPVVGSAKEPIIRAEWPAFGSEEREEIIEDVINAIEKRMKKVLRAYIENLGIIKDYKSVSCLQKVGQFGTRLAAKVIERKLRDRLKGMAEQQVRAAMDHFK